jgi:hypothetical protein
MVPDAHLDLASASTTSVIPTAARSSIDSTQQAAHTDSNLEGRNAFTYANGNVYEGEWQHDLNHGTGTMSLPNGDVYIGEWQQGAMCGRGRYIHSNGTLFEGFFKDSKKNGRGRCVYRETGSFANESVSYSWNAGDVFDGEFVDNVRHGRCNYTWATGDTLSCDWVRGNCPAWEAKNNEIKARTALAAPPQHARHTHTSPPQQLQCERDNERNFGRPVSLPHLEVNLLQPGVALEASDTQHPFDKHSLMRSLIMKQQQQQQQQQQQTLLDNVRPHQRPPQPSHSNSLPETQTWSQSIRFVNQNASTKSERKRRFDVAPDDEPAIKACVVHADAAAAAGARLSTASSNFHINTILQPQQ